MWDSCELRCEPSQLSHQFHMVRRKRVAAWTFRVLRRRLRHPGKYLLSASRGLMILKNEKPLSSLVERT